MVVWVCWVIADGGGSMETVGAVGSFVRCQLGFDDSLGAVDDLLQSLSLCGGAAGVPCRDAIHEDAFNAAAVEGDEQMFFFFSRVYIKE